MVTQEVARSSCDTMGRRTRGWTGNSGQWAEDGAIWTKASSGIVGTVVRMVRGEGTLAPASLNQRTIVPLLRPVRTVSIAAARRIITNPEKNLGNIYTMLV